jgi:hypothetical protein
VHIRVAGSKVRLAFKRMTNGTILDRAQTLLGPNTSMLDA